MHATIRTVAASGWSVGWTSNSEGAVAQPFRGWFKGRAIKGEMYGRRFDDSDACREAMIEHGYIVAYRPSRLSRLERLERLQQQVLYRGRSPRTGWFPSLPSVELDAKCDRLPIRRMTEAERIELGILRRERAAANAA